MKNSRMLLPLLLSLLLEACSLPGTTVAKHVSTKVDQCYRSFDEFAYVLPTKSPWEDKILPFSPWQIEATLPENIVGKTWFSVEMIRDIHDHTEIWLKTHSWSNTYFQDIADIYQFVIYRTDTKEWSFVSAEIENNDVFAQSLYVTPDGAVWGRNVWDYHLGAVKASPLSKYNEATKQFEFVNDTEEIPAAYWDDEIPEWTKILIDSKGVFWFMVPNTAIYSYDSKDQTITRYVELPSQRLLGTAALRGEDIYFVLHNPAKMGLQLGERELYLFSTETKETTSIKLPTGRWPNPSGLLIDHLDRLWLGAVGYRETNGTWKMLHPSPSLYLLEKNMGAPDTWYSEPQILMESSDGRLWFAIQDFIDAPELKTGLAWYDPQTTEGCWFTSGYTSQGEKILEDQHKNLWLEANGNLYKYSLQPNEDVP